MSTIPIEIVTIGFSENDSLIESISYMNKKQNQFFFSIFNDDRFTNYQPNNNHSYTTIEIYKKIDDIFKSSKGFHNLVIAVVKEQLNGKTYGNLFGSMETNDNGRLTGKAITSLHGIKSLIYPISNNIYLTFEMISFSIRFIVGKGMIHDRENGCLFHRKIFKTNIVTTLQSGYISLDSLKTINKYIEYDQIQQIQSMLVELAHVARSSSPKITINKSRTKNTMSTSNNGKTSIFISYSHKDTEWLERLRVHIKPLERKGLISPWDDTKIKTGIIWKDEIEKALTSAQIAILLVSADFLASDFIVENELPPLLASAKEEGTIIICVIIKPCLFSSSELAKFKPLNSPSEAIIQLDEAGQEKLFVNLANSIKERF